MIRSASFLDTMLGLLCALVLGGVIVFVWG